MFRRLFLMCFVISIFSFNIAFSNCYFDTYSSECPRFSSPYNSFNVNIDSEEKVLDYKVSIYNKRTPANKLKTVEFEENSFRNVNPFIEPGVYVFEVEVEYKSKNKEIFKREYIFDNTNPTPPAIPINLKSNTTSIIISGSSVPNSLVYAQSSTGVESEFSVDSTGSFEGALTISPGPNIFEFYTSTSSAVSTSVKRVIYGNYIEPLGLANPSSITIDSLDSINTGTYELNGKYYTSSRDFIVSGFANGVSTNSNIYVNAEVAVVSPGGKFASVLLLNEGENEIIIKGSNIEKKIVVIYNKNSFKFKSLDYEKVISIENPNLKVIGETSIPGLFDIYLNGEYQSYEYVEESSFDITIDNLKLGPNYVFFLAENGEYFFDIIYVDSELPQITLESQETLAIRNELVFKIEDDYGVDINKINLFLGPYTFSIKDAEVFSDYYIFDISTVEDGEYSYELSTTDLSGNQISDFGLININKDNTLVERVSVSQGNYIGNNLFLRNGVNKLVLTPSRFIAFERIFIDGKEITDYEIKANGNIEANINFENPSGNLELNFINNDRESFTQVINYFTDFELPIINLDYIGYNYRTSQDVSLITGEIIDSAFDWETLKINDENSFLRFGNRFEAYLPKEKVLQENLKFTGTDISGNNFENGEIGAVFDFSNTKMNLGIVEEEVISGSFLSSRDLDIVYVNEFDGYIALNTYVADNFKLPYLQIDGIRSLKMTGVNSYEEFSNEDIIGYQTDNTPVGLNTEFKIFLRGNDYTVDSDKVIIQGKVRSNSYLQSVKIGNTNCQVDKFSFVCNIAVSSKENTFTITARNSDSTVTETIDVYRKENLDSQVSINELTGERLFEVGGVYYTLDEEITIRGTSNNNKILKVITDGREKLVGDKTGNFNINLDLKYHEAGKMYDEYEIEVVGENELETQTFSSKVKVIFNRVANTIVDIIVG